MRKQYSTLEAAKMLGLLRPNLQRAIRNGLPAPELIKVGPMKIRLWTDADVERARRWLKKAALKKAS
jgi:hypothetical protein